MPSLFIGHRARVQIAKTMIVFAGFAACFAPNLYTVVTEMTTPHYERAEAVVFDAIDFVYDVYSYIAELAVEAYQYILQYKETVLDPLVWFLTKALIRQLTRSLVDWINNDFNGAPGFVTDFEGFATNVLDNAFGDFIASKDLAFLCDAFSAQIRLAILLNYRRLQPNQNQCTLTGIIANVNSFLNGDFLSGGWDGWFSVTQNAQNNPYGSFLHAQSMLELRLAKAALAKKQEVDAGRGILSWETCPTATFKDTADTRPGLHCVDSEGNPSKPKINTPGSAISEALSGALTSDQRQLELADEFNEVIGALAGLLMRQVFSSSGGGLSGTNSQFFDTYTSALNRTQAELEQQANSAVNLPANCTRSTQGAITCTDNTGTSNCTRNAQGQVICTPTAGAGTTPTPPGQTGPNPPGPPPGLPSDPEPPSTTPTLPGDPGGDSADGSSN